ncbi:hypothetical protein V6Z12_A03G172200 [Gossypium hirsutum]
MREALVEWIVVSVSDLHREYTLFEATRFACFSSCPPRLQYFNR